MGLFSKNEPIKKEFKDEITILSQTEKYNKTGDFYSDLINGVYNHDGWEIYRVFRDNNNEVIRTQFKKGLSFKVVNPGDLQNVNL